MGYAQLLDRTTGAIRADAVQRADGAIIPRDVQNIDWQAFQGWCDAGNAPAAPPVAVYRDFQIRKLYAACEASIAAGFLSSALGSPRLYPMKLTDQQNRDSAYLDLVDVLLTPTMATAAGTPTWLFWCQDPATGAWARVGHTAAQVRQARLETRTALVAAQAKLAGLIAQVNAATTAAAVQAVAW